MYPTEPTKFGWVFSFIFNKLLWVQISCCYHRGFEPTDKNHYNSMGRQRLAHTCFLYKNIFISLSTSFIAIAHESVISLTVALWNRRTTALIMPLANPISDATSFTVLDVPTHYTTTLPAYKQATYIKELLPLRAWSNDIIATTTSL